MLFAIFSILAVPFIVMPSMSNVLRSRYSKTILLTSESVKDWLSSVVVIFTSFVEDSNCSVVPSRGKPTMASEFK